MYELFCTAHDLGTPFLVRTCVDRLAGDGGHTIADEMPEVRIQGLHRVELRDKRGVMRGGAGDQIPPDPRSAVHRQARELSRTRIDCSSRARARCSWRQATTRLEAHHELAGTLAP